ncbi:class I SAM-dependent methyltransferase [Streptomyces sp. enrichment culture]|uniref:class I SAM-dependent methyltransferase n=1 Tax=Streptomyces sp. enrichment culture TaxID=1795815 RepID=UPI003F568E11
MSPLHADPRRDDCPWCGSRSLRSRTKPGPFTVDECGDCAHVFQNPRPVAVPAADVPGDGVRAAVTRLRHRLAARAMLPFPEPESWLDVGTGHAEFPETARALFPYTAFDGVDTTPRIQQALAVGRLDEAHIGALTAPAVLTRLRARYDVVSLLHHLERTPDPRGELRCALSALRPGGHILIESTDPRRLPLPRVPHLLPPANLRAELEAEGCELVTSLAPTLLGRARVSRAYRVIARKRA